MFAEEKYGCTENLWKAHEGMEDESRKRKASFDWYSAGNSTESARFQREASGGDVDLLEGTR